MMLIQFRGNSIVFVAALALMAGCHPDMFLMSMGDAKRLTDSGLDAIKEHDGNVTEQHKLMSPEVAAKLEAQRQLFTQRLDDIVKAKDALEADHARVARDLLRMAGSMAGLPDKMTNEITSLLVPRIEDVQREVESANTAVALASARVNEVVEKTDSDLSRIERTLSRLREETTAKLSNASSQTLNDLDRLRGDGKAFRERMESQLGLTKREMKELEGMSTDEIMALLLAAGVATGAGGVLSKAGKSRSHAKVELLEQKLQQVIDAK